MLATLTALESRAMAAARQSSRGNGHDFGFVENVVRDLGDLKPQAVGALIASLSQKGVLTVWDAVTTDSGRWTQFVLADEYREEPAAAVAIEQPAAKPARVARPLRDFVVTAEFLLPAAGQRSTLVYNVSARDFNGAKKAARAQHRADGHDRTDGPVAYSAKVAA